MDENTGSALSVRTTERALQTIKEECGGDIKLFETKVENLLKTDPTLKRGDFINEEIEEEIQKRNQLDQQAGVEAMQRQAAQAEAEKNAAREAEAKNIRERDEDLALQQQCDPMDIFDPDG